MAPRTIFFYTGSRALGGAEFALFMLAEALDRAAWQPTLLIDGAGAVERLAERARALDVPVRVLRPMPLGLDGARHVPGLVRLLRAERPAVFHAHLSWPLAAKYALLAAVAARIRAVVATVHLIPQFDLDRSSFLQLRALSAGVERYIAVSRAIATELVERFRWPEHKIEVIRNAVLADRFTVRSSDQLRTQLSGQQARPVVLTCARLELQKGHSALLRAAAQVPDAVFVLAGEGPERAPLEAQAAALGIADRVRFLGFRPDVPELLGACDVFALPSLYEGTSLALLEAMAAGRAIVSSAIPGTDELIDDGRSGLLVAPGDADALAAALRRLLGDAALRTTLAGRAREAAMRDFSPATMVGRVSRLYEQVLAAHDC